MKTYTIKLNYELEIDAEDEEEAKLKFMQNIEDESQQTFSSFIEDNLIVKKERKKHYGI